MESPSLAGAPGPSGTVRRWLVVVVVSILVLFGTDAILFQSGLYSAYLEPDSSTGLFEMILRREQQAQSRYGRNLVITLGDSRFAYYPRVANQQESRTGYFFRQAGVAGTDVRAWYYMLRDLDPTTRRYRAIVLGVDDYDDEDGAYDIGDDVITLHYVIARLRPLDVWDLAQTFDNNKSRWATIRGGLLKGTVYQRDILAFLSHPLKRIEYVQLCRRGYEEWTYDFVDSKTSVAGFQVDWKNWKATLPPGAEPKFRDQVERFVLKRPQPQTGARAAFRRKWFARLLDRYSQSPTRIIFIRLPRGPVPRPEGLVQKKSGAIRELASRPDVTLLDEHQFDSLERPELFKDAFHLNDDGCSRFSVMLAEAISAKLGQLASSGAGN